LPNINREEEGEILKDFKNHILICNWSQKGEKIIKELHSPMAVPEISIIVLSNPRPSNEKWLRNYYSREYNNVEFREGNPVFYETLKGANASMARAAIILSNTKSSEPDAESVLITLAINTLWKDNESNNKEVIRKPRIVVEVQDHHKMQHLKDAGADDIICAEDYAIGIIAQAAINEKLSEVYHDLLTYCEGTNEIYIVDNPEVSKNMEGKTFREISRFFLESRSDRNPAILMGFRCGENIIMNPREDMKFSEKDALILLAYDIPDVMKLISKCDD